MHRTLIPLILVASSAVPPTTAPEGQPIFIPLKYAYDGYLKVMADLYFRIPSQTPVETIIDLSSDDF